MSIQGKFCMFSSSLSPFSKGNLTFGFSRILTQTLTHTGIRVHGTSGTNRASERGFPSPQGRKSAQMSPHRIQTAAHNPKVVGSSPASATINPRCESIWDFFFLYSLFTFHLFPPNFRTFPVVLIYRSPLPLAVPKHCHGSLTQTVTHTGVWSG